jgi:hypothetical protein
VLKKDGIITVGTAIPPKSSARFGGTMSFCGAENEVIIHITAVGEVFVLGERHTHLVTDILAWRDPPQA